MKGCIIYALLFIGLPLGIWYIFGKDDKKESKISQVQEEKHYPIIKGDYSHYVGKCRHISDSSVIKRGYATYDDLSNTPDLLYLYEGDTLRLNANKDFSEAAIVFKEQDDSDTLDFKIVTQGLLHYYIIKISDHNTNYEKIESIRLIYKFEGQDRKEFVLSKKEFANEYKGLVKYLNLKKLKKTV